MFNSVIVRAHASEAPSGADGFCFFFVLCLHPSSCASVFREPVHLSRIIISRNVRASTRISNSRSHRDEDRDGGMKGEGGEGNVELETHVGADARHLSSCTE